MRREVFDSFKNNNRTSSPCTRRPVRKIRSNSHPFFIVRPWSDTYDPYAFCYATPYARWPKMSGRENRFFSCAASDEVDKYLFSRNIRLLYDDLKAAHEFSTRQFYICTSKHELRQYSIYRIRETILHAATFRALSFFVIFGFRP